MPDMLHRNLTIDTALRTSAWMLFVVAYVSMVADVRKVYDDSGLLATIAKIYHDFRDRRHSKTK